jgi:cobalt/nickel transport protein
MHRSLAAAALAASLVTTPAVAHFQLVYTPEVNLDRPGEIPLRLVFWHPMDNGHVMDMAAPEQFFMRFRGERTDLADALSPIVFTGLENEGQAFAAEVELTRSGDYTFAVVPAPYYEESEDIYIQQFTKSQVNRGGLPTDWMEPVGLPTEIVPLGKPYGVVAGSTFSGVVLSDGEPVAGAEIEIEYLAAEPDVEANAPASDAATAAPGGGLSVISEADGSFTFGIPKAGHWGFAALGSGPATEHEGKELSQDAVLWVHAHEMN